MRAPLARPTLIGCLSKGRWIVAAQVTFDPRLMASCVYSQGSVGLPGAPGADGLKVGLGFFSDLAVFSPEHPSAWRRSDLWSASGRLWAEPERLALL